jgi:hypothetical protein
VLLVLSLPFLKYELADAAEKCWITLSKQHNPDKFCDSNNKLQSHKAVALAEAKKQAEETAKQQEAARRAALTPMQRCEEDHKTSTDPESGDVFIPICHEDGTYDYKSPEDLQDELQQNMTDNQPSTCNIKGNISYNTGEKIYHVPGDPTYDATVINPNYGERWFCSEAEAEAQAAGWRRAYN